jgi:hypothetical protein
MKIATGIIFILLTVPWLSADEVDSYDTAMKMAAKMNKPILIDFWRDN